jgi:hypothetical protein
LNAAYIRIVVSREAPISRDVKGELDNYDPIGLAAGTD